MATSGNIAGWKGDVFIGAPNAANAAQVQVIPINRWNMVWRVEELDTTSFDDLGFRTLIPGIASADITLEGIWNTTAVALDASPNNLLHNMSASFSIIPGMNVSLRLFIDFSSSDFYRIPRAMCCDFNCDTDVHGVVKWTGSFKTQGRFFYTTVNQGIINSSDVPALSN